MGRLLARYAGVAGVFLLLGAGLAAAAPADPAIAAAERWLDLVDRERYGPSWDAAGVGLKEAVSQEEWAQTVAAARLHRGIVLARRLVESVPTATVAGLPPGNYALVSFETAFRGTGDSVESLIVSREGRGGWKVVAYFVRPYP